MSSILDNDLYKFTMQQAVLELYPDAQAGYELIQRRPTERCTPAFLGHFLQSLEAMSALELRDDEFAWLSAQCPYLKPAYLEYLQNYRFDPSEVTAGVDQQGKLSIAVCGPWHRTILWEVPLLALVSELDGLLLDANWSSRGQREKIREKGRLLGEAGVVFADFGTRRRRSYAVQDLIVQELISNPGFLGTSNVHLAHKHGTRPIGTMAHEWIMAHSVLAGLRHANRFALDAWARIYRGELGIALTDTYGTPAFFEDFDGRLARLYDGVRQDSGDPQAFADRTIEHYRKLGIDPMAKTIVFSDGVTPPLAVELARHCRGRIGASFGIGTNLTNDFEGSPPLDIVIKLVALNGSPVVKLTDDPGKATGTAEALRVARWTFCGKTLDG